jgi:type VI secretion system protein ImpL
VAPTRAVNLWFSRRTIFAEAGGGMVFDAGKWSRLVKRLQPRASVVGKGEQAPRAALVCFDCENFTKPGGPEIATNSARGLRARLGEISQAMGINLPVYVLFTKTDRLPFFAEYVRNLTNDESTQVLGVTLPMVDRRTEGIYAEEETLRLTGQFERLFRSLADGRIEFLAREGDASKLPPAYEFPREFRKVRPALVQFLVDLCRPSQLTVGPFLRGFYFTGVRPVVINEMAPVAAAEEPQGYAGPSGATSIFAARGMPGGGPARPAPQQVIGTRKVPQWLFLAHLFNDILLADKSAMGASGSSTKTSSTRRWLFIAGAALSFLLIVFLTISFFNNRGLETDVRDAARGISAVGPAGADVASLDSLRKLEDLRKSLQTLAKYRRDGHPWLYRGFLYIGDDLYKAARPIYCDRFRKLLLTQTQDNILQDMRALPATTAPEQHPYQPTYDELKAYLITTSNPEKSTKEFLTPVLMRWWTNRREVDADRQQLAQKQFDFFADALTEEDPCSSAVDTGARDRARTYLKAFGGIEQVYGYMLAEADKHGTPVNFNRQYPGAVPFVVDGYDVRGAFSKGGWIFMNDNFGRADQFFSGEKWVLGDQSGPSVDAARLAGELKARYSDDFKTQWTNYVRTARVLGYGSLQDAAQKLRAHSSNTAPLLELSSLASRNTAVPDASQAGLFQPVQSVTPPENTDRFVAPSNQNYVSALAQLQSQIESIAGTGLNDAAAAQALQTAMQAKATVNQMAQAFRIDSPIQQMVQKLLTDPITYAEGLLKGASAAELNAGGKGVCNQINPILAKYPFKPNNPVEATLPEVDTVFKPKEGAVWQFVDTKLVPKYLARQGSQYVPIPGTVTIQPAFLNWINRAAAFSDVAFAGGAADPHLNYTIRPVLSPDMEKVALVIDGQNATFTGAAAAPKAFVWPGSAQGVQVTVTFQGGFQSAYPSLSGLWSVFKWMGEANRRNGSVVEWDFTAGTPPRPQRNPATGQPITIKFDVVANPPIFNAGYFAFSCVSEVAR